MHGQGEFYNTKQEVLAPYFYNQEGPAQQFQEFETRPMFKEKRILSNEKDSS